MRFGLHLDMRNRPDSGDSWPAHYGRWLERLEEADRLGADSIWLSEHHFFDDGYLPQLWTFAAAVAARTSRARIGTAVNILPLHTAVELAEQIAIVDVISGGRTEPGFGVGYRKPEYRAFNGDFKGRYRVFAERIVEMRELWGETGTGRTVTPRPVQSPVPMWGGFGGPMGARLAGRLGLGLQSINPALLDPYKAGLAAGGHDPASARVAGSFEMFVTDDPERTWAEIGSHLTYRGQSYQRYMFEGTSLEANPPKYAGHAKESILVGTPQQIVDGIAARTAGLPVEHLYTWADHPGISAELVDRHIELVLTEVAPLLRQRAASPS
ncbi:MAG: LLM class flavin-dependent oxidoreductase [Acidobacteria bacterium]|nr:LLM class flavin-dependent oxidoreductase [Acidobacteriota bacterium]